MFNREYANRGVRQAVVLGMLLVCRFAYAEDAMDDVMTLPQPSQFNAIVHLLDRYPVGSITTMTVANRAVEDVKKMRTVIDAQFVSEQADCNQKFFATVCLSDAKERHRMAADQLRRIEIEANRFKRRANVAERDRALAIKREKGDATQSSTVMKDSNHASGASSAVSPDLQRKDPAATDQRVRKHLDGMR